VQWFGIVSACNYDRVTSENAVVTGPCICSGRKAREALDDDWQRVLWSQLVQVTSSTFLVQVFQLRFFDIHFYVWLAWIIHEP
jgi:hypothetical protein